MGDITFNGTSIDEVDDEVYFNGTALALYKGIYINDTRVWTKHPYEPGTVIFTYRWDDWYSQGNPVSGHTMQASGNAFTVANFVNSYPSLYPNVFQTDPYFYQNSGGSNTKIRFRLADGFTVSYYRQSQLGIDSDGDGTNTGGLYELWRGNTVSGLSSLTYGLSKSGSGNNWSEFSVKYLGRED